MERRRVRRALRHHTQATCSNTVGYLCAVVQVCGQWAPVGAVLQAGCRSKASMKRLQSVRAHLAVEYSHVFVFVCHPIKNPETKQWPVSATTAAKYGRSV